MIHVPLTQYKCPACKSDFFLQTPHQVVSCPNASCQYTWSTDRAINVLHRGKAIEFQLPDVSLVTRLLEG